MFTRRASYSSTHVHTLVTRISSASSLRRKRRGSCPPRSSPRGCCVLFEFSAHPPLPPLGLQERQQQGENARLHHRRLVLSVKAAPLHAFLVSLSTKKARSRTRIRLRTRGPAVPAGVDDYGVYSMGGNGTRPAPSPSPKRAIQSK